MSYKTIKEINVEGVVLPNHPLSNFEVIDIAKKLKIKTFVEYFLEMSSQRNQEKMNVV